MENSSATSGLLRQWWKSLDWSTPTCCSRSKPTPTSASKRESISKRELLGVQSRLPGDSLIHETRVPSCARHFVGHLCCRPGKTVCAPIEDLHSDPSRDADRRKVGSAASRPSDRDPWRSDRKRVGRSQCENSAGSERDRSLQSSGVARTDRFAHTHISARREPGRGGIRCQHSEISAVASGCPRNGGGSPCTGTGIHHVA